MRDGGMRLSETTLSVLDLVVRVLEIRGGITSPRRIRTTRMPAPAPLSNGMQATHSTSDEELNEIEEVLLQYDRTAICDGLDELHDRVSLALASGDALGHSRSRWQTAFVGVLRLRFEVSLSEADLDRAQEIAQSVLSSTSSSHRAHVLALFHLSRIIEQRREFRDNRSPLVVALDYSRRARELMERSPGLCWFMRNDVDVSLGCALTNLAFANGTAATQLEGIRVLEAVVSRLEDFDSLKALALYYLSNGYSRLAEYQPERRGSHILTAMALAQQAFEDAPISPQTRRLLINLSDMHHICYRMTGEVSHLYDGIAFGERAIALTHEVTRFAGLHLRITAELLTAKYEAEGLVDDLDTLIKYEYMVVGAGPSSPYPYSNLCEALCIRFQETGTALDIDNAIQYGMKAIKICETSVWQPIHPLVSLGLAYTLRFLYDEDRTDYEAAREYLEDAVKLCKEISPTFDSPMVHALEILATLSYARCRIQPDLSKLDLAVSYLRIAVAQPLEPSNLPRRLSLLGECLVSRALADETSEHLLDEAIVKVTEAVDLAALKSHNRHLLMWRRGNTYRRLFEVRHDEHDFERAMQDLTEALRYARLTDHPKQSFYEDEIAGLFSLRIRCSQEIDRYYLKQALDRYSQAATNVQGFIADRFQAAVSGGELAMEFNLYETALRLFTVAVQLVPRIAWLGLNTSRRHAKLVSSTSQLVCNAAAAAIMCGELERAVELLEEGRSVLWKSMLDLQADVTALAEVDPGLATELMNLGKALEYDDLGLETTADHSTEQRVQRRRRMAERWDSLLVLVRQLEGFETFLLPLSFSTLQSAALEGPVIIFNASRYATHALVLQPDARICCVSLPKLGHDTLTNLVTLFTTAMRCTKDDKGCRFLDGVLTRIGRRLWFHGISDVLQTLHHYPRHAKDLSRIWLLPTGLFSLLPLHCAGVYDGLTLSLAEAFILSHTSTLSALLDARKRTPSPKQHAKPQSARMLAVFQPDAPGLPTLWAALEEKRRLAQSIFPGQVSYLFGDAATMDTVKTELSRHNWFHCCSHGTWRPQEPLKTALQLRDGPVRLFDLLPLRLKSADFAFLSACHTARHGPFLPDESLHLAAALQVVGFRGVLATQWAMADCDGPVLADLFYRALGADGRPADPRNAAEALHISVGTLRDAGVPLWRRAAFVHYGL